MGRVRTKTVKKVRIPWITTRSSLRPSPGVGFPARGDGTTGPALKTLVVMPQSLSDVASPPSSILRRPASSSRSTTLAWPSTSTPTSASPRMSPSSHPSAFATRSPVSPLWVLSRGFFAHHPRNVPSTRASTRCIR